MSDNVAEHGHHVLNNFQNTSGPDIDLDRDVLGAGVVSGVLDRKLDPDDKEHFRFNIATIIMSTLIFLAILAWFDFMQTAFYEWLQPETQVDSPSPASKFYYALLATAVVAVLCALILMYSHKLGI